MRPILPIYNAQHLYDQMPHFFHKVSQYRDGKPKTLIGRPKPDQVRELSYFVAKIWHRAPARVMARQHSVKGDRNHIYWRTYWHHTHCTYGLYSIKWGESYPYQLSEHAAKAEALAALAVC